MSALPSPPASDPAGAPSPSATAGGEGDTETGAASASETERPNPAPAAPVGSPGIVDRLRSHLLALGTALAIVAVALAVVLVTTRGEETGRPAPTVATTTVATAPPPSAATAPQPTPAPRIDTVDHRAALLRTMTNTGLTEAQAGCVADKVEKAMTWQQFADTSMEPAQRQQLTQWMKECVVGS